jgi:predicted metal-dependent phosphoesterase TrpH
LKIDMHVHTARFSTCSTISPESAIEEARANGLDGLVFTEHNLFWPPDQLEELRADYPGIELFNGAEIDVPSLHHVLTILPEPDHAVLHPDSPEQFIRDVRKRGGVMIAAHPFRFYRDYDERNRNHSLDGVEIASRNMHDPDLRRRSETLASDWNSWTVANSDAHSPGPIGRFYSVLPEPVSTESDLIRTLREESPRPEVPSHARE